MPTKLLKISLKTELWVLGLTSEGHGGPRLGVHLDVAGLADLADVVAHRVAAALAAAEAHATVEHLVAAAAVRLWRRLLVQQGVDEQVDGALVLALHGVCDGYGEPWGGRKERVSIGSEAHFSLNDSFVGRVGRALATESLEEGGGGGGSVVEISV